MVYMYKKGDLVRVKCVSAFDSSWGIIAGHTYVIWRDMDVEHRQPVIEVGDTKCYVLPSQIELLSTDARLPLRTKVLVSVENNRWVRARIVGASDDVAHVRLDGWAGEAPRLVVRWNRVMLEPSKPEPEPFKVGDLVLIRESLYKRIYRIEALYFCKAWLRNTESSIMCTEDLKELIHVDRVESSS